MWGIGVVIVSADEEKAIEVLKRVLIANRFDGIFCSSGIKMRIK